MGNTTGKPTRDNVKSSSSVFDEILRIFDKNMDGTILNDNLQSDIHVNVKYTSRYPRIQTKLESQNKGCTVCGLIIYQRVICMDCQSEMFINQQ